MGKKGSHGMDGRMAGGLVGWLGGFSGVDGKSSYHRSVVEGNIPICKAWNRRRYEAFSFTFSCFLLGHSCPSFSCLTYHILFCYSLSWALLFCYFIFSSPSPSLPVVLCAGDVFCVKTTEAREGDGRENEGVSLEYLRGGTAFA